MMLYLLHYFFAYYKFVQNTVHKATANASPLQRDTSRPGLSACSSSTSCYQYTTSENVKRTLEQKLFSPHFRQINVDLTDAIQRDVFYRYRSSLLALLTEMYNTKQTDGLKINNCDVCKIPRPSLYGRRNNICGFVSGRAHTLPCV